MALIFVYKNRGITKILTFQDGDGDVVVPGAGDEIRFRVGLERSLDTNPLLLVTSAAPTGNGSTFTKDMVNGQNTLRLDDADLNTLAEGVYTASVELVDSVDEDDVKQVSRQVFVVESN